MTYASPCPFRGHIVPHLVVQTDRGPLTVMVLEHVKSVAEGKFTEGKYRGIVLPAGSGSIAVVARKGQEFDGALEACSKACADLQHFAAGLRSAEERTQLRQPFAHALFD